MNISFKSTIKIVSPKEYEMLTNNMAKSIDYENIFDWNIRLKPREPEHFKGYRVGSPQVSTENIRSCTSAFFITPGEKTNLAMHLFHSKENIADITLLESYMKGSNALLVGSKSEYENSTKLFKTVEELIKSKKIPMTVMEDLSLPYEVHMACDSVRDTIYMCIKEVVNYKNFVKTLEELKSVFKRIAISPKDTIEFVVGQIDLNCNKLIRK